jgi:hypothetical protein
MAIFVSVCAQVLEVEVARLRQSLADAARQVAAAQARAAESERRLHDKSEAVARQKLQVL